ncbi:hypothetical protein [Consotaella aegiceratis]|uniref:hypothetical protein n=1 Tax=Consotaella aegiceratis TaxID=3097961 RepID=UPI002F4066F6
MRSDRNHPFFRPLWRRVAVVTVVALWCALEWWGGDVTWGAITLALLGYAVWAYLIAFDPEAGREGGGS